MEEDPDTGKTQAGTGTTSLSHRLAFPLALTLSFCFFLAFPAACMGPGSGQASGESGELDKRLEQLRALPYTSVTTDTVNVDSAGVLAYDPDKAYPGYNMYCCEVCPDIMLIDMRGEVAHTWFDPTGEVRRWHHAVMLPGGDVIAIAKSPNSLMRLDWNSAVIWRKPIRVHHDLVVLPDSTLYVIGRERVSHRSLEVELFLILHLSLSGEVIDSWSAFENLSGIRQASDQTSFLDTILDSMLADEDPADVLRSIRERTGPASSPGGGYVYDYFHVNTIGLLPETPLGLVDKRFAAGNLLICMRNVNQIAVLDRDTKEFLWVWGEGALEWPHHPTMLEDGNILVFDNGVRREYSRVIEVNPTTRTIEWEYLGDPPESFYSYTRGSAQRLPNGNTLVSEGDRARAFEVTRDGEIVWRWINPRTRGKRRAQVYRMMRLEPEIVDTLLTPR
jgi:hypothetical protein